MLKFGSTAIIILIWTVYSLDGYGGLKMQREMIYLRELDSVLKSKEEVIAGQEKMYDAIVNRGYCVVISLNQLTDAAAFLGPIKSKRFEESMEF